MYLSDVVWRVASTCRWSFRVDLKTLSADVKPTT
jgi:hypothetical protein